MTTGQSSCTVVCAPHCVLQLDLIRLINAAVLLHVCFNYYTSHWMIDDDKLCNIYLNMYICTKYSIQGVSCCRDLLLFPCTCVFRYAWVLQTEALHVPSCVSKYWQLKLLECRLPPMGRPAVFGARVQFNWSIYNIFMIIAVCDMAENVTPALSTVRVCHFYGFASPQQCIIKLCKNLNLNLVHAHMCLRH